MRVRVKLFDNFSKLIAQQLYTNMLFQEINMPIMRVRVDLFDNFRNFSTKLL